MRLLNRASATAIVNNSWGALGYGTATPAPAVWKRAVRQGLKTGWGGKGTVYVFAAGNGALVGSQANLSELTTHYGVLAICGTGPDGTRAPYSETGATLWVLRTDARRHGQNGLDDGRPLQVRRPLRRHVERGGPSWRESSRSSAKRTPS